MKNLKKISSLFILALVALAITSCDKDDNKTVLKFTPNKVQLEKLKTASVVVSNGTTPYTVTSGDPKIATVTIDKDKITITGVANGNTTITVIDKKNTKGIVPVTVLSVP